jgi:hypothetical protein
MLKHFTDDCWTQDQRVEMFLSGLTASDPDTGAELSASNGRRKSGRGTRYTCRVPNGETRLGYLGTNNPRPIPCRATAFSVTAHTEAEAIERANKALTRFLAKRPAWDAASYTWVFPKEAINVG